MSKNDQKVPALRFKGFTDDWIKQKLSDSVSIVSGGTPSTKIKKYWNGEINWFTPTEIGKNIYAYSSKRKITNIGLEKSSAKLLPKNKTILFTSRASIGESAILKKDATTNQGFQSLVIDENTDIYFLYAMTGRIRRAALRKATGSTFLEISASEMKKIQIFVPNIFEQNKIGSILKTLDKIIALEQKKLEQIKRLKTFLIYNLLPFKYLIPNLRIQSFNKNWKKEKINDVAILHNKDRIPIKASDRPKGNTPYYGANGILGYINGFTHNGEFTLVAEDGANDISKYPTKFISGKAWINNHAHVLSGRKNKLDTHFLSYRMQNINFAKYLVGSGRWKLNAGILINIPIIIPEIKEQKEICKIFSSIDSLIDSSIEKTKKYYDIKESLLQNLFI